MNTDKERQAEFRARMRRDGWRYVGVWVHQEDKEALKRWVEMKRKAGRLREADSLSNFEGTLLGAADAAADAAAAADVVVIFNALDGLLAIGKQETQFEIEIEPLLPAVAKKNVG